MKTIKGIIIILFTCVFYQALLFSSELKSTHLARQATVKIIKTYISPNYCIPWKMRSYSSAVGSGAIIGDKLILTNAHVVSDSTFIHVQKENDPINYEAEVLYVGHDCDLALLKVKDKNFFENTVNLEIGQLPELRSRVATYGYPIGGERISITEGVVSRIEVGMYTHSKKSNLLMIQTDAAINAGNSGGPVVQDGRIQGIAFQAMADSSNIGYMIPTPVIRHFLEDVKDGHYDGFPDLGISTDNLLNASYREYLGMSSEQTGVVVTHALNGSAGDNKLKKEDVLLSIDGNKIANDGTIPYGDSCITYSFVTNQKQVGDSVSVKILRDRKTMEISMPLGKDAARVPWYDEYETKPRYYIYAGIVFQPLNREFLECWDKWWYNADRRMLYYFLCSDRDNIRPDRKEFVIINQVLPDAANSYISDFNDLIVDKINNRTITKLEDVVEAFKKPVGNYHIIESEGYVKPIILKASETDTANKRILKKYDIPADRMLSK